MFKNLVIRRPLAVIDVETTGTDVRTDRIVEIAVLKFLPDGSRRPRCRRVNPGIPIPEAATAIHGIRDEDVQGEPRFDQIAARLVRFLDNCDLCGFNLKRFDLKLILAELERSGQRLELDGRSIIDPLQIYHDRERRDLAAAVRFYCGREHADAHGASADAMAAAEVLDAMLVRYSDLPKAVEDLQAILRDDRVVDLDGKLLKEGNYVVLNFGKHKGRTLDDLARQHPDYLEWMLGGSFHEDTKTYVRSALARAGEMDAMRIGD